MSIATEQFADDGGRDCVSPGRGRRVRLLLPLLGIALAFSLVLSAGIGAVEIPAGEVMRILLAKAGLVESSLSTPMREQVVVGLRLPRVVLGMLVGAMLGVAGTAAQGLFRNPLAEPGVIGISSGAGLAVVAMLVLGGEAAVAAGSKRAALLPLAAFGGALAAMLAVKALAGGRNASVGSLILSGVAVNAFAGAGLGLLLFLANDSQLRAATFWSMGSIGGASWRVLAFSAPPMLVSMAVLMALARPLNALLLGEAEAMHLGVAVRRVRATLIAFVAVGVGAAVSFTGAIGFVGLLVPHLLRLVVGPDHRHLLPGSALLGALLLTVADTAARTVAAPLELPVGVLTALAGAPCFLWLMRRSHREATV